MNDNQKSAKTATDHSDRLRLLEERLHRTQWMLTAVIVAGLTGMLVGFAKPPAGAAEVSDEIRTRKLVVVDHKGVPRIVLSEDPANTQRRARSAGVTIFDDKGHERGGMATFTDGSVVFALDAPRGVGAPMPDRVGITVKPDGSAHIMLLDNETRAVVKLYSDGKGGGGPQLFKWDMDKKKVHIKTILYDGEDVQTTGFGG